MIKQILTAILLVATCGAVQGQTMYGTAPSPGDAIAPSGGGNVVNVDMFTGTGSVGIPIYNYSIDGITCGVSLGYNAKGIKVDEVASSVGLGWHMFGGGSITRRVMGIEDEVTTPAKYSTTDHLEGYMVPGATLVDYDGTNAVDDKEKDVFYLDLCGRKVQLMFYYDGSTLKYHTYPDVNITVDLITKDWNTTTSTYSNIRSGVQNGTGLTEFDDILTFNVTDEKGNKFYFERGDYELKEYEFENDLLITNTGAYYPKSTGTYYATTKWDLVKVETFGGYEVTFEYESTAVDYVVSKLEVLEARQEVLDANGNIIEDPLKRKDVRWNGRKTHLSQVNYPNGKKLLFDLDKSNTLSGTINVARCDCKGDFRVKKITIEDEYDSNVANTLSFVFDYDYFSSPIANHAGGNVGDESDCSQITVSGNGFNFGAPDNTDAKEYWSKGLRLRLKEIRKLGADNSTTEDYYKFDYNMLTALPQRLSPQKDYYGYYNGGTVTPHKRANPAWPNNSSIQYHEFYTAIPFDANRTHPYTTSNIVPSANEDWGADRSYNFTNAKAFVLNKITNALSGEIDIEYTNYTLTNPSNQYYYKECYTSGSCSTINYVATDLEGTTVNDGLCVSKITFNNNYSTEHGSSIEYTYSGGVRFNRGGYTSYTAPFRIPNSSPLGYKTTYHNNFIGADDYYNGSNHGFSTVTKEVKGFNNQVLSKEKFYYSNLIYDDNGTSKTNMYRRTGADYHLCPSFLNKFRMGRLEKHEVYEYDRSTLTDEVVTEKINSFEELSYGNPDLLVTTTHYVGSNGYKIATTPVLGNTISRLASTESKAHRRNQSNSLVSTGSSLKTFEYDTHHNMSWEEWTDSKGEKYRRYYMYNYDYKPLYAPDPMPQSSTHPLYQMVGTEHLLSTGLWKMTGSNATDRSLISMSLTAPKYFNGQLRFPASFATSLSQPLAYNSVLPFSTVVDRSKAIDFSNYTSYGADLDMLKEITLYGTNNTVKESRLNNKDIYHASIADYKRNKKIATVSNAKYEDVAYNSFEVQEVDNAGNWTFNWSDRQYMPGIAMTGKYVYQLTYNSNTVESNTLSAKKYIISFWGKYSNGTATVELVDGSNNTTTVNCVSVNTVGDWELYTAEIEPALGDKVRLSNNDLNSEVFIDELRLYPKGASMTTWTYEPMFGVSSVCNESNYIVYYQYNTLGALEVVKDMRGNVRTKIEAVTQGADTN